MATARGPLTEASLEDFIVEMADEKEKKSSTDVHFDAELICEVRYKWHDKDHRGLRLAEPFFGMSINGSTVIDVESVVERWLKRHSIEKHYTKKTEG